MTTAKLTSLAEGTVLASTDLVYVVVDPGGSPISKKATIANVVTAAGTVTMVSGSFSGLLTAGSIYTGGTIGAVGNIVTAGTLSAGNIHTGGTIGAGAITSSALITGANISTAGTVGSGAITSTGLVTAANYTTAGTIGSGAITSSGLVKAANLSTAGTVGSGAITSTGLVTAANISTAGTIGSGAITSSGLVTAANYTTAGTIGAGTVTATGLLKAGGTANYINIDVSGLRMYGTATVFGDEIHPLVGQKLESPASDIVSDPENGALTFKDSASTADYVTMSVQINHDWKINSPVYPHVHWWQASTIIPNWVILHRWQVNGSAMTMAWGTQAWTSHAFSYSSGTLNQISAFGTITPPANSGISDILQLRLFRDVANDWGAFGTVDGLSGNVQATSFDVHKEIDSIGSNSEYTK